MFVHALCRTKYASSLLKRKSCRADLDNTVKHANVFESGMARRFLVDVCERLAGKSTRIFLLEVDGKVVAVRVGFLFENELYLYFSGFDPDFGKYSVMTTTVAEAIKWAITNGVKRVNLSTGNDVSKTRWGPNEVLYHDVKIHSELVRGRVAAKAFQVAMRTKDNPRIRKVAGKLLARRAG